MKLRAEQALLCLAPGVPQGRALNRCIAQSLLKVAAISYAFVVALLALSIPIVRDGAYQHFTEVMMAVPACFVGVALHDYAQMPTIAQQGKWLYYLLYGAGIQLALSASWQRWPIAWVDGPILLCAAMVLMWRWRGIVNAPSCFPAGRASHA